MENKKVIYIQFWNADTGEMEWREFASCDVDSLMELEILDVDTLGYYMDDPVAFDATLLAMTEKGGVWSWGDLVADYLARTDHEIRIPA